MTRSGSFPPNDTADHCAQLLAFPGQGKSRRSRLGSAKPVVNMALSSQMSSYSKPGTSPASCLPN